MLITKRIEWCMAHRLANHDGKCRNPHGHHYVLEVGVEGDPRVNAGAPDEGMVADFGALKALLTRLILDPCDHAFMYAIDDPVMSAFYALNPGLKHVVLHAPPTAENIVLWIHRRLDPEMPALGCRLRSLRLWETPTSSAAIEN